MPVFVSLWTIILAGGVEAHTTSQAFTNSAESGLITTTKCRRGLAILVNPHQVDTDNPRFNERLVQEMEAPIMPQGLKQAVG